MFFSTLVASVTSRRIRLSLRRSACFSLALVLSLFAQSFRPSYAQSGYQTYRKISGQLEFEGITDPTNVSYFCNYPNYPTALPIYLWPNNGGQKLTCYPYLDTQGNFTLTDVPAGSYRLVVHESKWLQRVVSVDVTASDAQVGSIFMAGGDANGDNSVDSTDFGILIGAFNTDGSVYGSGYDATADFNCDGYVDSTDFGILIGEFNNIGDSLLTLAWDPGYSGLALTGGATNDSQDFTLNLSGFDYGASLGAAPQLKCSLNNALALRSSSGTLTNLTTTPLSALSWSADPNQVGTTKTFTLVASTVNYPTKVTVTATYSNNGQDAISKIDLLLLPTSMRITDVFMPNVVNLQWDCSSSTGFILKRINPDGSNVTVGSYPYSESMASDAITDSSGNPVATFGSSGTYTYQLWSQPFMSTGSKLLATEKVTPVKVVSSENQSADSRLDLRYAQNLNDPHYVDFAFGGRTYRGGLFAGYVNTPDNSRVGRSFAKYNLSTAIPSDKTFRSGSVNAFFTQAYPAPNGQNNASNVDVLCYNISSSSWSALGDASGAGALVWTNSVPLMQGANLASGLHPLNGSYQEGGPVNLRYTPPPAGTTVDPLASPSNWAAWDMSDPIRQALLGNGATPADNHLSSAWTGAWDISNQATPPLYTQWAYFAKNEYGDHAHGPCLVYALSSPVPVLAQFGSPAVMASDGSYDLLSGGGTIVCSIIMNGVGIGDTVTAPVTLTAGGFATISNITDMSGSPLRDIAGNIAAAGRPFQFIVKGLNRSFKFTVTTPLGYYDNSQNYILRAGSATVSATLNGVTAANVLRVQGQ